MLTIQNITKSFGGVQAIKGSNFTIEKNKVTALIGPNGAGKTTLFNVINGLLRPDTGSIVFEGVDITKKQTFRIANTGISRTFQQVRLFHYLTILEHLQMAVDNRDTNMLGNIVRGTKVDRAKFQNILDTFGIERELDTPVSDLSYGQRKLLNIAMALTKPHELLMLDEPVAGVNAVIQEQIEQLLLELKKKGETMLIIDHDMQFVRKLADHVIVLDAGVVLLEGAPEIVLKDKRVLEAYLGE